MKSNSPSQDETTIGAAVRSSLRQTGASLLRKLVFLGAAHDIHTGRYADPILALELDATLLSAELRCQHRKYFRDWLILNVEQQYAEVVQYFEAASNPSVLLREWIDHRCYEKLISADAIECERQLFLTDFETVLTLASSELQHDVGLQGRDTPDALLPELIGKEAVRPLLFRVAAKHYLAHLWGGKGIRARRDSRSGFRMTLSSRKA